MYLCQCCDSNGISCRGRWHGSQKLNSYNGCPSSAEFAKIWAGVGEIPNSSVSFDISCGSLIINENNSSIACLELRGNELISLVPTLSLLILTNFTYFTPSNRDFVVLSDESSIPKVKYFFSCLLFFILIFFGKCNFLLANFMHWPYKKSQIIKSNY